jgi:hypothetical protein
MISGSCHCGAVSWRFESQPTRATACNCTLCRRYGALWIYGHENEDVFVSGPTSAYLQGDKSLANHFCTKCGCMAYWRGCTPEADGRTRVAVNARLADDPESVANIPVKRFDGFDTWTALPDDGRKVGHVWF